MNIPPFALEGLLPDGSGIVEFQLTLHVARAPPPSLEDYEATREVVGLFCAAVDEQLLSADFESQRGRASLQILDHRCDASMARLEWRMRASRVPPEAFLVLVALLAQTHYSQEPLERVSIMTVHSFPLSTSASELLSLDPKGLFRPAEVPFAVEERVEHARRNVAAVLEFEQALSSQFRERLKHALNVWEHLVVLGGFEETFERQVFLPNFGRITELGPRSMQIHLAHFDTSRLAVNSLVCLGTYLHQAGYTIDSLCID